MIPSNLDWRRIHAGDRLQLQKQLIEVYSFTPARLFYCYNPRHGPAKDRVRQGSKAMLQKNVERLWVVTKYISNLCLRRYSKVSNAHFVYN